jgi:hypothetical protein
MLFRTSRVSKNAFGFLTNFVEFSKDSIAIFGFDKGSQHLATTEWLAGSTFEEDRGSNILSARIAVPFQSFYMRLSNHGLNGRTEENEANFAVHGSDEFQGFRLSYRVGSEQKLTWTVNYPDARATALARKLKARFVAAGATDTSGFWKGM